MQTTIWRREREESEECHWNSNRDGSKHFNCGRGGAGGRDAQGEDQSSGEDRCGVEPAKSSRQGALGCEHDVPVEQVLQKVVLVLVVALVVEQGAGASSCHAEREGGLSSLELRTQVQSPYIISMEGALRT